MKTFPFKVRLLILGTVIAQVAVSQHFDNSYLVQVTGIPSYVNATEAADGGILVFGTIDYYGTTPIASLFKVNRMAQVDTTFQKVYANYPVDMARVLPDGKILISGRFTAVNGVNWPHLVRLNADGTLDDSFKLQDGTYFADFKVQSDGKILANDYGNIQRFYANGSVDPSFKNQLDLAPIAMIPTSLGIVALDQWDNNLYRLNFDGSIDSRFQSPFPIFLVKSTATALYLHAAQSDDKVFVSIGSDLYRLNTDGSIDSSFKALLDVVEYDQPRTVTVRKNGRILVAGSGNRGVELNPDGSLYQNIPFVPALPYGGMAISSLVELNDGKVLVPNAVLSVLNSDMTTDPNFNAAALTSAPNFSFYDMEVDFQGKALFSTSSPGIGSSLGPYLFRTAYDGTRDTSFNAAYNWAYSMALQEDGKILAGLISAPVGVVRMNIDGSVDTSFQRTTTPGFIAKIKYDGAHILVGGRFTTYGNVSANAIVKLDKSGAVVGTFDMPDGVEVIDFDIQSNGAVVAMCSGISQPPLLYRFYPGGELDHSFPVSTVKLYSDPRLKIDSKDRIYLAGTGVPNRLMRLTPEGAMDANFQAGTFNDDYPNIQAIEILPDGSLVVGGSFTSYNDQPCSGLVIIKEDGSSTVPTPILDPSTQLLWVKYAAGNLYVGGRISMNSGRSLGAIARVLFDDSYLPKPSDPRLLSGRYTSKAKLLLNWVYGSGAEDGFVVERSTNSSSAFEERSKLYSKSFEFIDDDIDTAGTYYYRVKAFNKSGSSSYSNTFKFPDDVTGIESARYTTVFPNPTRGQVTIMTSTCTNTEVFDILGRPVKPAEVTYGDQSVTLNLGTLPDGVYCVVLNTDHSQIRVKVVKNQGN